MLEITKTKEEIAALLGGRTVNGLGLEDPALPTFRTTVICVNIPLQEVTGVFEGSEETYSIVFLADRLTISRQDGEDLNRGWAKFEPDIVQQFNMEMPQLGLVGAIIVGGLPSVDVLSVFLDKVMGNPTYVTDDFAVETVNGLLTIYEEL